MADKYTKDDVIIWPDDPRLKGAIGKKVFYSQNAILCLKNTNYNFEWNIGILVGVSKKDYVPFKLETYNTHKISNWMCIIIKKED